jgi:hypothetical protein
MRHVQCRRALLALGLAASWGIATACSSFSGDSSPAPTSEAGADASTSVEAGEAGDASTAARFCKTDAAAAAAFCADFDEGPVDAGWQLPYVIGGKLETTPSDRSAPNALLATVDTFPLLPTPDAGAPDAGEGGTDGQPYGVAVLSTTLGRGAASGAVLELDMRIDELPTAPDGSLAGGLMAAMGFDIDHQAVTFSFFQGRYFFVVHDPAITGGAMNFEVQVPSPPRWFHVRMMTRFDGSIADLSFDGIQVATTPQGLSSTLVGLVIDVGPSATATTGKARIAYDNVTLTLL